MKFDRDLRRKIKDHVVTILAFLCVVVAIIPLASILYTSIVRGAQVLSIGFLTGAEPTEGEAEAVDDYLKNASFLPARLADRMTPRQRDGRAWLESHSAPAGLGHRRHGPAGHRL